MDSQENEGKFLSPLLTYMMYIVVGCHNNRIDTLINQADQVGKDMTKGMF